MDIEIQSKTDNSLFKRTEVHFLIHHEAEKTPKRDLVRSELADKLKTKKENILIDSMHSSFGSTDTIGYAKIYKSLKEAESQEKKHILKRNNALPKEKKEVKEETKPPEEKPQEKTEESPGEEKKDESEPKQDVKEGEEKPKDEGNVEKTKEEPTEDKTDKEDDKKTVEEKKE